MGQCTHMVSQIALLSTLATPIRISGACKLAKNSRPATVGTVFTRTIYAGRGGLSTTSACMDVVIVPEPINVHNFDCT